MRDLPVAFVIFNRPEMTAQSFEPIRRARPNRLFLISDAARDDHPGEEDKVEESRRIAEAVDWECQVTRIYADENLGCGKRIGSGIGRAFEEVERLVILEDDCIADDSFFDYCDNLLNRYRDDSRVMAVSGNNFQQGCWRGSGSYYFSKYPHCWGWATWRRAWQRFDLEMRRWPRLRETGWLARVCDRPEEEAYWNKLFDKAHSGRVDTWDFPWVLSCWQQEGLTALPNRNLVSNIGFGPTATHTKGDSHLANIPRYPIGKLTHPSAVIRDRDADEFTFRSTFAGPSKRRRFRFPKWLKRRLQAA